MKLDISIQDINGEGYLCIKLADLTVLKRSKAFKPPTVEEVAAYCKSRKNGIDAALFIDYYQTRGWQLSKGVKMKDWQSAVRTWEKNTVKPVQEITGRNIESEKAPANYGIIPKSAVPMPESIKKRLSNIGNT